MGDDEPAVIQHVVADQRIEEAPCALCEGLASRLELIEALL
jgi:hypothetical protein